MEQRTGLKEKRNNQLWFVFFLIYFISLSCGVILFGAKDDKVAFLTLFGVPLLFVVYRVLTYIFNCFLLLLFRRKKWKIDRLKGRITPIYKVIELTGGFSVTKYETQYTKLDLEWSIPFSVLFEEQEYIELEPYYFKYPLESTTNISLLWEEEYTRENLKYVEEISAKTEKQQKIDNLNKVFNENYK